MVLAVLEQLLETPLRLDEHTCVLAALTLNGRLESFHGMIPSIQQAIELGFRRIILPAIDLRFLGKVPQVDFVMIHDIHQLLQYVKGQTVFNIPDAKTFDVIRDKEKPNIVKGNDFAAIDQQLHQLSITCFDQKWSHRTQLKIIRIARTIADLEGTSEISDEAMEEAIAWKKEGSQRDVVKPL